MCNLIKFVIYFFARTSSFNSITDMSIYSNAFTKCGVEPGAPQSMDGKKKKKAVI